MNVSTLGRARAIVYSCGCELRYDEADGLVAALCGEHSNAVEPICRICGQSMDVAVDIEKARSLGRRHRERICPR